MSRHGIHFRKGHNFTVFNVEWLSQAEVQSHLKRKLTGRINGRAAVIINAEKEFSLVYKVNLNQCIIEFYYGVWNSAGFPLHHYSS